MGKPVRQLDEPTQALTPPETDTDWLAVAQRITSLYQPPHIGRPSDALTDVYRIYKLLTLAAEGNYPETAIRSAGFAKQTYYNWKDQAERGNIAAIALLDALEKAFADAEVEDNRTVKGASKAGPQYWPAAMTRLERRYPDRWGKRQDDNTAPRVVVQIGVRDGDVQVSLAQPEALSPDTRKELA